MQGFPRPRVLVLAASIPERSLLSPLKVLICDAVADTRAMLRAQLADHLALDVVGEAAGGEEAIERAIALVPDVVLMDVDLPGIDGVEATRRIRAALPGTRVVAFAASTDTDVVMAMREAGASAYCARSAGSWELERAITEPAPVDDLAESSFSSPGERREAESAAEVRRDAVTGLGNRRAFDERLDTALAQGDPPSLVLLDLDDFTHINDTRGHDVGDRVLRQVAIALLRQARAGEEVFRVGGQAFAAIVDGDSAAAFRLAARMRAALARQRRGEPLPTLSGGVASATEGRRSREELIRGAEAALYAAKWSGKNRVLVFGAAPGGSPSATDRASRTRILVVDDDHGLRTLLRATFEAAHVEIVEARDADAAAASIPRYRPDVVVLDIAMPGMDGLTFCRTLKAQNATRDIGVVLLTGSSDGGAEQRAREAGADAFVRKPFSPLELLSLVEDLASGRPRRALLPRRESPPEEQLLLYADDLRRMLELERGQRALLERAYRDTVTALASALESKDSGTGAHSERVQRYAAVLTRTVDAHLLEDVSLEYGFLLHDIGKIGIPDRILLKPTALSGAELQLMQMHTVLGEQMLGGVALLQGEGLRVVRSHHERWDGAGYPDGLAGTQIPLGARIFAVADTLDAVMSERPYRSARPWAAAVNEIVRGAGGQFDPGVVRALHDCEAELREIAGAFTSV